MAGPSPGTFSEAQPSVEQSLQPTIFLEMTELGRLLRKHKPSAQACVESQVSHVWGRAPTVCWGGHLPTGSAPPQSDASLCGNQRHKDAGPGDRSHSSPGPTAAPGEPSAHPSSLQRPRVQKWGSKMGVTTGLGLEHEDKSSHISRELLRVRLSILPVKTPDHPKMARSK